MDNKLALIRKLNKESHAGFLFCYKALIKFNYDYQQALAYLNSDAFKHSWWRLCTYSSWIFS